MLSCNWTNCWTEIGSAKSMQFLLVAYVIYSMYSYTSVQFKEVSNGKKKVSTGKPVTMLNAMQYSADI